MKYYDTYDYMYSSSTEEAVVWILMIYLIVLLVVGIFSLASYIIKGIGMYTIAKRQGRENAWIAFVPFARTYLHGELGGSIKLKNKSIQSPGIWLLALPFIYGAVISVFYVILWVIGFSTILTMSDDYYYGPTIGAGTIMGIIVLALIVIIVSVIYEAVYKVLGVLVNHQIYERFTSKNMSIAHAVLSAVVPLYESICLFVMRNKPYNPGMEPEIRNPYAQMPPEYSWKPAEPPVQSTMGSVPPMYPPMNMEPPMEAPKAAEAGQPAEASKAAEAGQPMEAPKAVEAELPPEAPKAVEAGQPTEAPEAAEAEQTSGQSVIYVAPSEEDSEKEE